MEKTYLIQMAYSGVDNNGINYQYQKAKNKKLAVCLAVANNNLKDYKLVLISVKRVPKKLVELVELHNSQFIKFKTKGEKQ